MVFAGDTPIGVHEAWTTNTDLTHFIGCDSARRIVQGSDFHADRGERKTGRCQIVWHGGERHRGPNASGLGHAIGLLDPAPANAVEPARGLGPRGAPLRPPSF